MNDTNTGDEISSTVHKLIDFVDKNIELKIGHLRKIDSVYVLSESLSLLGDYGLIWVLIGSGVLVRQPKLLVKITKVMAISGFGSIFASWALKSIVSRPRPNQGSSQSNVSCGIEKADCIPSQRARWLRQPGSMSFPSGHTVAAFSAAYLMDDLGEFKGRLKLLAFLIGLSRIVVNDHYPTDVIAGAAVGIVLAKCSRRIVNSSQR